MRKLLLTSIFGIFLLVGSNLSAQVSDKCATKLDEFSNAAITTVNAETTVTATEKQKVIGRINAITTTAKNAATDADAKKVYVREYARVAENYKRITGKSLPEIKNEK